MWFFNKKHDEVDLSWLHADMHSHLIAGIDDGAPDLTTSVELVRGLVNLGYKKLITTPHIFWDLYPNTPDVIAAGIASLKQAVGQAGLDVELSAAAEYYMDEHFEEDLANRAPFLKVADNKVLIEFSMVTAKIDLQEVLFEVQMQNYQPIIAHPERYSYLINRKHLFDELKSNGCLFQLNLLSLTGYYGKTIKELAEYLVKKNYYDYAGTDLHHEKHLSALHKLSENKTLLALKDSNTLRNALL